MADERRPFTDVVVDEVRAERYRQVHEEGYGDDHDSRHDSGELARAAACYCLHDVPWVSNRGFFEAVGAGGLPPQDSPEEPGACRRADRGGDRADRRPGDVGAGPSGHVWGGRVKLCCIGIHGPLRGHEYRFTDVVSGLMVFRARCPCGQVWLTDSRLPFLGCKMRLEQDEGDGP